MSFPVRLALLLVTNMVALWVADQVVSGFKIDQVWPTLIIAGAVLGLLDFFVKPIMKLFALPFILLTLGLMLVVINAAILGLMALFVSGVSISGFVPALKAAIIVSIVSWVMIAVLGLKKD
jgi:putative membrane protein